MTEHDPYAVDWFRRRAVDARPISRLFREACVRCSLLRPDPAQRARIEEIRDNLNARIAEAEQEGWLGEVEGLRVSLAGAEDKLTQLDRGRGQHTVVDLAFPTTRGDQ